MLLSQLAAAAEYFPHPTYIYVTVTKHGNCKDMPSRSEKFV